MIREFLEQTFQWLKRVVTQPREELDRWQSLVRSAYDLSRFGARQLRHDRAPQMAAALSYRTLFGLLPVLVVCTVLVKALGLQEVFLEPLGGLFEFWGLNDIQVLLPTNGSEPSTSLGHWMTDRVREVEQINWAVIGWVGVGVTLYASISLMVTIEDSFNIIYRAPQGRAWSLRVPLYWFALTLSPVAVVVSTSISSKFQGWMRLLEGHAWLSTCVDIAWNLFSIWVMLLLVYLLLPNKRVRVRPAMIGALVTAVLLEIGKRTMGAYLSNALSISQLYGSLGLVPLFMLWVYLMWLAVLFGLQVGSTLQHLRGRQLAEWERQQAESAFAETSVVLVIMQEIAGRFRRGETAEVEHLAQLSGVSEVVAERILQRFAQAGMIHRVAEEPARVALSRPPESIRVDAILEIGFQLAHDDDQDIVEPLAAVLEQLRTAQLDSAEQLSLAQLLPMAAADASP